MRSLGCVLLVVSCLGCAETPDYGTGSGGSGGSGGGAAGSSGIAGMGGGGAGGTGPGGSGSGGIYVPPALTIAHPNPIISRGKPAFASAGNASSINNGTYHNSGWSPGTPSDATPAWVAINLGAGPTRVLVSWDDGGTYDYQGLRGDTTKASYGFPSAYRLEVSADSTNGADGSWTMAAGPVTGNPYRTRAHAIAFAGKSWVKMVITALPTSNANGLHIGEIDVHDISATPTGMPDDTWFFMGDSITAFAYQRTDAQQPSFAKGINTEFPAYFPAMINGGVGAENTADAKARLDDVLAANPDYRFFALGYGTNDAAGNGTNTSTFRANMQMLIDRIKAAGRIPIVARIPYSNDKNHDTVPLYNGVIDELTRSNGLQIGPDFYAYFMAHTGELDPGDHLHPTIDGQKAMNPLWTAAARPLYPAP